MDTVDAGDLVPYPVRERQTAPVECTFEPCDYPAPDENVAMSPFGGPHLLRFTTSTHDERGYITKDPDKIERLNRHLIDKIEAHQDEIDCARTDIEEGAEVLLVSYGITARAVEEAVRIARGRGQRASALTLLSIWPIPVTTLREALDTASRVVVAELNDGQLRREVERLAPGRMAVTGVGRLDGELITPQQILEGAGLE
jgi:2-oxoglutarate ferredoxin oxidoreductase subunit alpha